jgi:3-deoxy-manno-octulosonate cytidylyltransferase (CMP-KDO synthetase)
MSVDFHVIIPARYQSSRLPGKLLMELSGMTVLERVYRQVIQAKPESVIIATDNKEIFDLATSFGAQVEMTDSAHQSGTDRIAEVVKRRQFSPDDIIVNVQGDEPLIAPALITQVANSLAHANAPMATLCWPIDDLEMCGNPNVVKVVRNSLNNALYFSRSSIPFNRDNPASMKNIFRHIGLYSYRAAFLLEFVRWPVCELEAIEALEQLRVLWAGYNINVDEACVCPLQDINTMKDLEMARSQLAG